jgi:hypothetical protein
VGVDSHNPQANASCNQKFPDLKEFRRGIKPETEWAFATDLQRESDCNPCPDPIYRDSAGTPPRAARQSSHRLIGNQSARLGAPAEKEIACEKPPNILTQMDLQFKEGCQFCPSIFAITKAEWEVKNIA